MGGLILHKCIANFFQLVRNIVLFFKKPFLRKGMHVEALFLDDVWEAVKKTMGKNYVYFITTPEDYESLSTDLQVKISKKEWIKKVVPRYHYLRDSGEEIGLHVHLAVRKRFITQKFQKQHITKSYKWTKSNSLNPKKFVAGWFVMNEYTEKIVNNLGMQVAPKQQYWSIHDYDLIN